MSELINICLEFSQALGYAGIVLLMTIESSFIPFPSELVIPPAAYLAQQGELNIIFVVIAGIVGSLLGATVNYVLARSLGRMVIYKLAGHKLARYFLISREKMEKAEGFFLKYGNSSTFFGRLVPAVRQLISIPAGFSRMHFRNFIFFTFLGSGIWIVILAILGYMFGANQELLIRYYREVSIFFVIVAVVLVGYVIFRRYKLHIAAKRDPACGTNPKHQIPNSK